MGQIQKRGREYEENIRLDYLKRLNEYYNKWIDTYKEGPLLIINIDKNKFAENEEHLGEIIQKVEAQLYGLVLILIIVSDTVFQYSHFPES